MLRKLAITSLILACGLGVAHADIWRWKDAQGTYHYSDQWVPGSELIKASRNRPGDETDTPRPAPASEPGRTETAPSDAPSAAAIQAVKQDVAKTRDQQCKDAKDAYQKAIQARRIIKSTGADGSREYLSDAEADAYRIRVKTDMDSFCGAAGK